MTKRSGLMATLLLMAVAAMAQPSICWLETEHDFGSFSDSLKTVTCQMRFVNTGDEPVVITQVKSSCGCTAAEYPRTPIAPGDTSAVELLYSSRNIPGEFEKNVWVYTNGNPSKTTLTVKGLVIGSPESILEKYPVGEGAVRFSHASLPLGEVTKGRMREAYVAGYNTGDRPMNTTVEGLPPHIKARVLPDTIMSGHLVTVSFFYDSWRAPLWGLNTDSVTIVTRSLADSTDVQTLPFSIMAQVKEDFSKLTDKERRNAPDAVFSTDKLDFGTLTGDEAVTRSFTIKNEGKNNLIIRRLYIPEENITAQTDILEVKKGKKATINVTVNGCKEAMLNTTLTVISNDPYQPRQTVRLVGLSKKND